MSVFSDFLVAMELDIGLANIAWMSQRWTLYDYSLPRTCMY